MLCANTYQPAYIDSCRSQLEASLDAYRALVAAGTDPGPFEPVFFNNLVLALDHCFVHRGRGAEKKDGNPLNEVRMLCASLTEHGGVLAADSTIRYAPERSVLGLAIGDTIRLDAKGFERLAAAFFAELEAKFLAG